MQYSIYMIRHGETWYNRYKKMQGWSDTPLTPAGEKVAQLAAQKLAAVPFDLAFTSDARRAVNTCQIICDANINRQQLSMQTLTAFRECFYGYFEGMNCEEAWYLVLGPHGFSKISEAGTKFSLDQSKDWMKAADPFHDAENAQEYWQRIDAGFQYLDQVAHDNAQILLITHGNTIKSIANKYGDGSFVARTSPDNSSLTKVIRRDGQTRVTTYGQSLID